MQWFQESHLRSSVCKKKECASTPLARELDVESKDLLDLCKQAGFDVKNQLSNLETEQVDTLKDTDQARLQARGSSRRAAKAAMRHAIARSRQGDAELGEPPTPRTEAARRAASSKLRVEIRRQARRNADRPTTAETSPLPKKSLPRLSTSCRQQRPADAPHRPPSGSRPSRAEPKATSAPTAPPSRTPITCTRLPSSRTPPNLSSGRSGRSGRPQKSPSCMPASAPCRCRRPLCGP